MGLMSWLRGGRSTDAPPSRLPGPAGPDRADRVDVSRLEPVQRSVTGQELLTNPAGFEAGLIIRQNAALGQPLGHLVTPEAPAGLVRGVVDAAPGSPPPPVQRAVEMPMPARPGTRRDAVAVQRAYGDGLPNLTSAGPASASAGLPLRQLVGEQPLVPPDGRTEPVGPAPHADTTEPGTPAPGAPPVQRTSADGPPSPAPPPPPSRRTGGLGAPLSGLPPTAQRKAVQPPEPPQAQRDSAPPPAHAAEPPAHAADPVPGPGESAQPLIPEAPGTPDTPTGTETVAPLLGDAPLKPEGGAPAAAEPPSRDHPAAPVQRTTDPPPAAPDRPTAPLLGDRPLTLRTADVPGGTPAVQRAAEGAGADGSAPGPSPFVPAPPDQPPAVAVRWTATEPVAGITSGALGALGAPGGLGARSAPAAPLQRAVAPVQRGTPPPPARPEPAGGRGPRVPASVRNAGAVAVAAGVAQRMADGSVVFPSAPRDGTSRPVVQRDSETAEEPPPPPLPEPGPEPGPEPEPPATEQPAATTSSSVNPDGTPQAPPVTDELVRALYAPLSRLLKADLRLERERSGSLINTRH
ncbi:hypothetical protein ABZ565_25510 [Streptomyces sp. NPDC016469]|uniref:hypothetical protein n=1 Tax=Streptomyces sp. NPDC016469 TaxID=3157191 RepID=UPI0033F03F03